MKLKKISKRGAFELSVTTMIIIVLAIVFLIMALVLLKNIFGGATTSIDKINDQMTKEIEKMFVDENTKVIVYLQDKTAKIRAGTTGFNFWIASRTLYGNSVGNWTGIQYTLELEKTSECYKKLGATLVNKWFVSQSLTSTTPKYNDINEFNDQDTAYAKIQLTIPEGTTLCSQDVKVLFYDNTQEQKLLPIGGTTFTIQVLRKAGI